MLVFGALFSFSDILIFGLIAALLAGAALYAWPWSRQRGRFLVGAGGTLAGWLAWNLVLSENNASSLDVDAPVVALSWQDVGSGVGAFLFTALALGVLDRDQPAGRVIAAAALAGAVTTFFDIFVL
jgi:hypothetical protein